jgi:hypothetical protein
MHNLQGLSQEQMGELLHLAGDAILAWPPPAPESSESPATRPILRAAGLGYILTWAGDEYPLPGLVGLRYLVTLIERSPRAIHCADLVDPTGQAKASLGQVWEPDVRVAEKKGPSLRKALATGKDAGGGDLADSDKAMIKTYLSGTGRHSVAGAEKHRISVYRAMGCALKAIKKSCPGAGNHISGKLGPMKASTSWRYGEGCYADRHIKHSTVTLQG